MSQPLLELINISKNYNNESVLTDINIQINKGEFISILGPSGCGKTTLLKLLAGFDSPTTGQILLQGTNINALSPQQRPIHTVFQNYALFPHLTVFNNVAFSLNAQKLEQDTIQAKVDAILNLVNLPHIETRYPSELSGGQQQRVALARALINQPDILLLDESLSALDAKMRKKMQLELKQIQRQTGITFIYVTHSQEEALSMSDRIMVLNNGQVQQIGTPREIYEEPNNLSIATFIGEANVFDLDIKAINKDRLEVSIEGVRLSFANPNQYEKHHQIHLIVRPEDLRVWNESEVEETTDMLPAIVEEINYKGSTVDLIVKLKSGRRLLATEFFDEDDEDLIYNLGEPVWVHWLNGWEVILPYEN